jgi:hypothetical protein
VENDILWKRITRPGGQQTVVVTSKTITGRIIKVHGNILYEHEGHLKMKEYIIQSYWWPSMDRQINKHLQQCDKCQRTKQYKRPTTNFDHLFLNAQYQIKECI